LSRQFTVLPSDRFINLPTIQAHIFSPLFSPQEKPQKRKLKKGNQLPKKGLRFTFQGTE